MLLCPVVCLDRERRSTIVVKVDKTHIHHIPMDESELKVVSTPYSTFSFRYNPTDYPIDKAAAHYLGHGKLVIMARSVKEELISLAGDLKATVLSKKELAELSKKTAFVDFQRTPVKSVTGGPLPTLTDEQEFEMATAKKSAAKKPAAKKPAAKSAKVSAATEKKGRKPGVGALITEGLLNGTADEKILEQIRKQFPESKSAQKDISWYRSKLKRDGVLK